MKNLTKIGALAAFRRDQRGATAIEYGLIAALLAVTLVAVFSSVSSESITMYDTVATAMSSASP